MLIAKSTETAVPVKLTICGELPALSVIVTAAERFPVTVGLKFTLIVQFAPTATLVPQALVCEKSLMFVPVIAIEEIESAALPPLVSVTVCAALDVPTSWFVNAREFTDSTTEGAATAPMPVSATD